MSRNFAFGVDMTMLNSNLSVTMSVLGVYVFPGYLILLPHIVHHILYESSFVGRNAATTRRYVSLLPIGIELGWREKFVLVLISQ